MTKEKFEQLENALVDLAITTAQAKAPESAVQALPGVLDKIINLEACKVNLTESLEDAIEEDKKYRNKRLI